MSFVRISEYIGQISKGFKSVKSIRLSQHLEFALWFGFIGFWWAWLLPNTLLCLLSLFPFSLSPFVDTGITFFHSMTQNLKQGLGLPFPPAPSIQFYNWLLVQICGINRDLKPCLVMLHTFPSPVRYQGESHLCFSPVSCVKYLVLSMEWMEQFLLEKSEGCWKPLQLPAGELKEQECTFKSLCLLN